MGNLTGEQAMLLAGKAAEFISAGNSKEAIQVLKPILDSKCPFPKLDLLGSEIGRAGVNETKIFFKFFDELVDYNAMGGFVIAGSALVNFLPDNFDWVMEKSREYIIKGDKWYVCDIIGERSIGQALVDYFEETLPWLEKFLNDDNKWVKRSAGTAIHFFGKRVRNEPGKTKKLLDLIEPHIEEKQADAVKGIGWGLKTTGRYHPDLLTLFLVKQLKNKKKISKLMIRKATTYLSKEE